MKFLVLSALFFVQVFSFASSAQAAASRPFTVAHCEALDGQPDQGSAVDIQVDLATGDETQLATSFRYADPSGSTRARGLNYVSRMERVGSSTINFSSRGFDLSVEDSGMNVSNAPSTLTALVGGREVTIEMLCDLHLLLPHPGVTISN